MAATGTPTPNIGLRIPLGTDPASVDDINYNSNLIDTKLGAVGNDSVQDQIDDLNSKLSTFKKVKTVSFTTTAETVVPAYGMKEISAMSAVLPNNTGYFISATLLSGTTAGLALLFIHQTMWGGTAYLSAKNISGSSLTIPSGMTIAVVYCTDD